jgi:dephospho-CoA kinase
MKIVDTFGNQVLAQDGQINRKVLGSIVFKESRGK